MAKRSLLNEIVSSNLSLTIDKFSNEELEEIFRSQFSFIKEVISQEDGETDDTEYRGFGYKFKLSDFGKFVIKHGTVYCVLNREAENPFRDYVQYRRIEKDFRQNQKDTQDDTNSKKSD